MKKWFALQALLALALCVLPATGQGINSMAEFVAKGNAGELTDKQIADYTAN